MKWQWFVEKPGRGVFLLQKKIADRKMFKARKQYTLASEPTQMIQANPLQRRHTESTRDSRDHDLLSMTTDDEMKWWYWFNFNKSYVYIRDEYINMYNSN